MSNAQNTTGDRALAVHDHDHDHGVETKPSFKTTEFIVYVVLAIGIIITAAVVGNGAGGGADHFDAYHAAQLLTFLTIGYMVARGLAKSGSRQPRD
jgi:hypothetical protein